MVTTIKLCFILCALSAVCYGLKLSQVRSIGVKDANRFFNQFSERFSTEPRSTTKRLPLTTTTAKPRAPPANTSTKSPATIPPHWKPTPEDYTEDAPNLPKPSNVIECIERPKHFKFGSHNYFYSAHEPRYQVKDQYGRPAPNLNWYEAFQVCREHCMSPVSIETEDEWKMVENFINKHKMQYTWTSGRRCNFKKCEKIPNIEPNIVNGWYWLGSLSRLSPTNKLPVNPNGTAWSVQPWLERGSDPEVAQPDNAEYFLPHSRRPEMCLGIIHRIYQVDRVGWHDIACHHKKYVMCEDDDELLAKAFQLAAGQRSRTSNTRRNSAVKNNNTNKRV